MVQYMKVISNRMLDKDLEECCFQMMMFMKESLRTMCSMEKESIFGTKEMCLKANSSMGKWSKEIANTQ